MKEIEVHLGSNSYAIRIEPGILGRLQVEVDDLCRNRSVAIITDTNVAPLYGDLVKNGLSKSAKSVECYTVPAGEASKSPETVISLMRQMLSAGITRDGILVALGGGVIGDLTGFLASVYLRGIPYIGIPTTLLAQVDSSVGGKTAVNLPEGKNLMGSFYQPARVIIDPKCIKTLNQREFSCGMAEVIKYGVIRDHELFCQLEQSLDFDSIAEDVIAACCQIKASIVEDDERDTGIRMLLNFGHTLGHAIEKNAGYGTLSHGAAVAIGMCMIEKYGEWKGLTQPGTQKRITQLCQKYQLPTAYDLSDDMLSDVFYDKKNFGDSLSLIVAEEIGKAHIQRENRDAFIEDLKRI